MTEVSFVHGVACGGVLTRAQFKQRQEACTRLAEEGLPDADRYRSWKAARIQEASQNPELASSSTSHRGVSWMLALTALLLAVFAFTSGTVHPALESALDALPAYDWRSPAQLASSYLPAFHLPAVATDTNASSVTGALFPEIDQQVSTSHLQDFNSSHAPEDTALLSPVIVKNDAPNSTSWRLEPQSAQQDNSQSSNSIHSAAAANAAAAADFAQIEWSFEDSLLKAAELECELAQMREENQQLSAHVLSATRQLASIGQAVQLPHSDTQLAHNRSWLSAGMLWTIFVLLLLLLACFGFFMTWRRFSSISAKSPSEKSQESEQQVQGLQQELQKLDRQVGRQQSDLMSAEQTIMSLSSGKAAVEVELRGSQQKIAGLQADLARAECLMDSHAVSKMKLPLFPMSPLAQPPLPRHRNKENVSRLAKSSSAEAATCEEAKQATQPDRDALLADLKQMEAEKSALEGKLATSQAEQAGVREACIKAEQQCIAMQRDTEALELRMFTTHEQLAVAQEREADLVAQLHQARNKPAPQQPPSCAQPQPSVDSTDESAIGQETSASAAKQDVACETCESTTASQLNTEDAQTATTDSESPVSSQTRPDVELLATSSQQTDRQRSNDSASTSGDAASGLVRSASIPTAVATASTTADSAATAVERDTTAGGSVQTQVQEPATTASTDAEFFPELVCRVKPGESGERHRMQSSPIYGVANISSQDFTPPRSQLSRAKSAGPKTPWSADWVTSFLTTSKGSHSSRRAGSISPTRLFEFNGDNTAPDPEQLFDCWHSK